MAVLVEAYIAAAWTDITDYVAFHGDPNWGIIPFEMEKVNESNIGILRFGIDSSSVNPPPGTEIRVKVDAIVRFAGYITTREQFRHGAANTMQTSNYACQDYNSILDRIVVPSYTIDAGDTDSTEIETLRATYLAGVGVTAGTIATIDASMEELKLSGTFRQCMEAICGVVGGAYFYINAAKALNYGNRTWKSIGAENLSDDLSIAFSHPYTDFVHRDDESRRINAVYIIGEGIEGWYPDPPGANYYQAIITDPSITTQTALDNLGAAITGDFGTPLDEYSLTQWETDVWEYDEVTVRNSDFLVGAQNLWVRRSVTRAHTVDATELVFDMEFGDHTIESGYLGPSPGTGGGGMVEHILLSSPYHSDADEYTVTRGALIVGDSTPEWNGLAHPASANRYIQANANDPSWVANLTMDDDAWIGAGAGAGRLTFNSSATPDVIWVGNANFDMNGNDFIIDTDGDSYLHASGDDVVDIVLATASGELGIHINGAEDFTFTANSFNVLAGSHIDMGEDTWIGIGAAAARLVFDSTPFPDRITVENGTFDLNANFLYLDGDADSYISGAADDVMDLVLSGNLRYRFDAAELLLYSALTANTLKIRTHGDVAGTAADIWAESQLGLAADENVQVFIDANNNETAAYFAISKNAENVAGATEIFRVKENATVGIGVISPAGILDARSTSTAGVPVVYMRQEDVSEEFMRFHSTAAAGVLTRPIVDYGDESTSTAAVWLKVYVVDDGNQVTDQAYHILAYVLA